MDLASFNFLPVAVHDRVETMSDGENRAVGEFATNRLLDKIVGLQVDSRRRLVENENLGFAQESAC